METSSINCINVNKTLNEMFYDLMNNKIEITETNAKELLSSFERLKNIINKKTNINSVNEDKNKKCGKKRKAKECTTRYCYMCRTKVWTSDELHKSNKCLCKPCGTINLIRRNYKKDITGKIAIITGGRIKIGYETAMHLLNNGCQVIVTTRFVDDCLQRYQKNADYDKFKNLLTIYQLDMLCYTSIMNFVQFIYTKFDHIDYLINNAAQTIQRPFEFYEKLMNGVENPQLLNYDDENQIFGRENKIFVKQNNTIKTNQLLITTEERIEKPELKEEAIVPTNYFPEGQLDEYGQQMDLRPINSWVLETDQVNPCELSKVMLINSIAPYILCSNFKKIMTKNDGYSWIINVSSMEGCFSWSKKRSIHPHTNMAKSALNMMTRTCGSYFYKSHIVMVSVDTGWNNSQYPNSYDVITPLDCIDGAARILWPIYSEDKKHSILYKDYEVRTW
jgi:NAD(P)-dependent dehydrogenase (short-subunit alcohol dehydrogenase family)